MTIVAFEKKKDPREVIATLEELLERAKAGEFEAFIAVCLRPNGNFFMRSSGYKSALEMIGAVSCAIHDIIKAAEV